MISLKNGHVYQLHMYQCLYGMNSTWLILQSQQFNQKVQNPVAIFKNYATSNLQSRTKSGNIWSQLRHKNFGNKIEQSTFAFPISEIINQYNVLPIDAKKWHWTYTMSKRQLWLPLLCYSIFVTDNQSTLLWNYFLTQM